mgnify:CR=1 FL=1
MKKNRWKAMAALAAAAVLALSACGNSGEDGSRYMHLKTTI